MFTIDELNMKSHQIKKTAKEGKSHLQKLFWFWKVKQIQGLVTVLEVWNILLEMFTLKNMITRFHRFLVRER